MRASGRSPIILILTFLAHSGLVGGYPQQSGDSTAAAGLVIDGPPAPVPPEVISRDAAGHATVRAVRVDQPLKIDGQLDESVYQTVQPISGFIQQEPHEGEPATKQTDAWVLFDDQNLYVSARCWDENYDRWVISGLQRDAHSITQSENLVVFLDTFYDRRSGFYFQTNPQGGFRDMAISDDGGSQSSDWNPVWNVRSARFEGGWSLEMEIPFKSLRYRGSGPQIWGINFRRIVRWKNELSYLVRVPAQYSDMAICHASFAGTLVGLETPAQSINLEVKPYVTATLTTDRTAAVPYSNKGSADAGVDLKYGVTRGLIADFTYNTDFAQVEEDTQQINLTRFSLLFPEKREFFLEGQGIFAFGGSSAASGGPPGGASSTNDVPILFFSRQIGLSQGQAVPVIGGGRLTGKAGRFDLGFLHMVTGDEPSADAVKTNFSVARLKRGILRQSYVGVLATRRSPTVSGTDNNLMLGADLGLVLSRTVTINTYYAWTRTPGQTGSDSSYRFRFAYTSDRYGLTAEQLMVGERFSPEVGLVRRSDFNRSSVNLRFSPRLRRSERIRKLSWEAGMDYTTDAHRKFVQTRESRASFAVELENGDEWSSAYTGSFEGLREPLRFSPTVVIPAGEYRFNTVQTGYSFGNQRRVSGNFKVAYGSFYGGTRTETGFSSGRVRITKHLEFEPGVSLNWVSLPGGDFTTRLITTRIVVMPTPRMLISSLIQYNSSTNSLSSSVRLRWEYTSGSELFLVYTEGRATDTLGFPGIVNRTLAFKLTRLFRF